MTEQSSFFNAVGSDREYDAATFAAYFNKFLTSGVYHRDNLPGLKVNASGLVSLIDPGSAFLEGYMYSNTEILALAHRAADATNPRIDRVVLRLDRNMESRFIKAFIKEGNSAATPVAPALQRDELIYEISLAQIRINPGATSITSITDERYEQAVCGLVSSLIAIPTDDLLAQWNNWFLGIQNQIGTRLLYGASEPSGAVSGDVWLRNL